MTISAIIIFLSILFALVVAHEFGHFLFAKLFGMRVDEFAFGFPPKLLSYKYKGTLYSFNLIPLGGFVKIYGENGLDETDGKEVHDKHKSFGSKSPLKRIIVLLGGVFFNVLIAIIFFSISLMHGSNIYLSPEEVKEISFSQRDLILVDVNSKSPLATTAIRPGDKIVSMESDAQVLKEDELTSISATGFVQVHNNSIINISYINSAGELGMVSVVPKAGIIEGKKILGAKFADSAFKKYSFFESIPAAVEMTYMQIKYIFVSLFALIGDVIFKDAKVEDSISGPVGLAMLTSKVADKGIDQIFFFAALLSLSLAVFNVLPIPALDGGRILFVLIEVIFRRKVKRTVEQLFHGLGFLALLFLMLFVTYFDIVKAFTQ